MQTASDELVRGRQYFLLNNMLAVIKTGGKQYLVSPGQKIKIEKLDAKEGDKVKFSEVLLREKQDKIDPSLASKRGVEIGSPLVKGAEVTGKVLRQGRGDKVIVFRYKSKTRRKKKKGHRQFFTEVEITGMK